MGMEQLEPLKWDAVERQPSTIVHMLVEWLEAHQHYDFAKANFSVCRHFGVISIIACVAAALLLISSVIFNAILVINIIRLRHLRISRIFLLQINVSVCDILRTCVLMPLTLVSIVSKDWVLGAELCHILPMMQQMVPNVCNLNFLVLAYEHYRGVQHAVTGIGQGWQRAPVAAFVIGIWLLGFVSMLPFGQFSQFIDLADILSDKLQGVGLCVVAQNPRSFEIFRLIAIAGFVVPFIVSLYLYFRALTDESGMQMYEDKKDVGEITMPTSVEEESDDAQLNLQNSDDGTSLKDLRIRLTESSKLESQPPKMVSPGGRNNVLLVLPPALPSTTRPHSAINPSLIQQTTLKDFLVRSRSKSVNVEAAAANNQLLLPPTAGSTVRSKSNDEIARSNGRECLNPTAHTTQGKNSPNVSPSTRSRQRSPNSSETKRQNRSSSCAPPNSGTNSRRSSHNTSPRSPSNKRHFSSKPSSHQHGRKKHDKYRKGSLSARMQPVSNRGTDELQLMQRRLTSASAAYGTCENRSPQQRSSSKRQTPTITENINVSPSSQQYNCGRRLGSFDDLEEEDFAGDSISQHLGHDNSDDQDFLPQLPITTTLRPYMRITLVHGFAQIPLNILVMVTALMAHHRLAAVESNSFSTTAGPTSYYPTVGTTTPSSVFRNNARHTTTSRTDGGGELWMLLSGPAAKLVGNTSGANVVEALFLLLFLFTMLSAIVGPWIVLRTVAKQPKQPQLFCYGYWLICFANKLAQLRRPSQQLPLTCQRKQSKSDNKENDRPKMTQIRLISSQ